MSQIPQSFERVLHLDEKLSGNILPAGFGLPVSSSETSRSPSFQGLADKLMSVKVRPLDGNEELSGLNLARITADSANSASRASMNNHSLGGLGDFSCRKVNDCPSP